MNVITIPRRQVATGHHLGHVRVGLGIVLPQLPVNLGNEPTKGLFHAATRLRRHFHETEIVPLSVLRSHLVGHLALDFIFFIPDEHDNHAGIRVLQDLLVPLIDCFEGLKAGDVVDKEGTDAPAEK